MTRFYVCDFRFLSLSHSEGRNDFLEKSVLQLRLQERFEERFRKSECRGRNFNAYNDSGGQSMEVSVLSIAAESGVELSSLQELNDDPVRRPIPEIECIRCRHLLRLRFIRPTIY